MKRKMTQRIKDDPFKALNISRESQDDENKNGTVPEHMYSRTGLSPVYQ